MKFNNILWGLVFVILGVILGLNALEITNINLFFKGWWTLMLIIPSLIGIITNKEKLVNIIILIIGIIFLLISLDVISLILVLKLFIPVIFVIVGLVLIMQAGRKKEGSKELTLKNAKEYIATFANQNLVFKNKDFQNSKLTSIFGNINCDLQAVNLEKETYLKTETIFGGITIIVPDDVLVKVTSNALFGGVSNHRENTNGKKIIYLDATILFGGVKIK